MKKWMLLILIAVFCNPQNGEAQYLSWNNLTIYAGGEYPTIKMNHIDDGDGAAIRPFIATGDISDFTLRPHVSINYGIPVVKDFRLSLFSGYSQLGGQTKLTAETRETITLSTVSFGIKALYQYKSYLVGPVFSWNTFIDDNLRIERKRDGDWQTVGEGSSIFLDDEIWELGFNLQRELGSHLSVKFEGLYSLNDVFINEQRWPEAIFIGDVQWYPRHYRLSIGYSF